MEFLFFSDRSEDRLRKRNLKIVENKLAWMGRREADLKPMERA